MEEKTEKIGVKKEDALNKQRGEMEFKQWNGRNGVNSDIIAKETILNKKLKSCY